MKAFWNDCNRGPESAAPVELHVAEAVNAWCDMSGVKGNFFGLVDDLGRTVQFYFDEGIPNHVDDVGHLRIVLMDFPQPELGGSYAAKVEIREVPALIEKAFLVGADHRSFSALSFQAW